MTKGFIVLIDDDRLQLEVLELYLRRNGFDRIRSFSNSADVITFTEENEVLLHIIDIELANNETGIDLAKILKGISTAPVIFMTHHINKEFFGKAKLLSPSGYLLKPINESDFIFNIELSLYKYYFGMQKEVLESKEQICPDVLFVNHKDSLVKIQTNDIYFLEASGSYTDIVTHNQIFSSSYHLKIVLDKLNCPFFLKVHRKYVVNLNKVEYATSNYIFIHGEKIPISTNMRPEVRKKIVIL